MLLGYVLASLYSLGAHSPPHADQSDRLPIQASHLRLRYVDRLIRDIRYHQQRV